jgi:hypothetical protein
MQTTAIEIERDAGRREPEFSPTDPTQESPDARPVWTPAQRVLFRFTFAYLILYCFPFPLGYIPYAGIAGGWIMTAWNALVPQVGRWVFHVEITVRPNGSGDTMYNYVQVFCDAAMAAAVAVAWTLLDRKRTAYPRLHHWLRVYVRFYLALTMFSYGSAKVIKSQFPYPPLDRLVQPFGDASPMGLLWTFMGASESYNIFTGAGELLGGLLLTTRRTTLLGSLVCFGVLSHVTVLNFSYDVPVKQFSMHLLAMSLFLMAPDLGRLAKMFVLNRAVEPVELRPLLRRVWVDRMAIALRTLVVGYLLFTFLQGAHFGRQMFGDLAPKSPLYGIWNVEEFEIDGKAHPPLVTDAQRWRRVIFDYPMVLAIQLMNDSRQRYVLNLDTKGMTMGISPRNAPPGNKTIFSYTQPEPGLLAMEGTLDGRKIKARIRRAETSDFLLTSRGFHWINEYPINR